MRLDRTQRIAGVPILRVRDFFRWLGGSAFDHRHVAERLKLSRARTPTLVKALHAEGLIEPDDVEHGYWQVTNKGHRLAAAKGVPPIPRKKAEQLIAGVLERARQINARGELTHRVREIRVFGSYLTPTSRCTTSMSPSRWAWSRVIFRS
jgi:hypothetical protein